MRRREFMALFGGSVVSWWPVVLRAQQSIHVPRIGFLGFGSASAAATRLEALRGGLRDLGYIEGKNILIEFRWADNVDQLPEFAAEFVRMKVDIILAPSSTLVEPARRSTKTIPIVFSVHADPVGTGHVASLARPGGNITGLSTLLTELAPKELEILTQLFPQAKRIGVLWNPTTPSHQLALKAIDTAGKKLGVQLFLAPARTVEDFDGAFLTMSRDAVSAVLVVSSPLTYAQRALMAELGLRHRLPAVSGSKDEAEAGGLASYGADLDDLFRRTASYIDKILRGAKPADLPVEQASKYDLVINLKTANALGLTIPHNMLVLAEEVIE